MNFTFEYSEEGWVKKNLLNNPFPYWWQSNDKISVLVITIFMSTYNILTAQSIVLFLLLCRAVTPGNDYKYLINTNLNYVC